MFSAYYSGFSFFIFRQISCFLCFRTERAAFCRSLLAIIVPPASAASAAAAQIGRFAAQAFMVIFFSLYRHYVSFSFRRKIRHQTSARDNFARRSTVLRYCLFDFDVWWLIASLFLAADAPLFFLGLFTARIIFRRHFPLALSKL